MSNQTLIQNDTQWLSWRTDGIGASDSPIILGYSNYSTRKKLLVEKVKKIVNKSSNPVANLGHVAEKVQREIFASKFFGHPFEKVEISCPVVEHPVEKWLRASIDGMFVSKEKTIIWEHKMTGRKKFDLIKNGNCPDDFYVQTQHQMYVTGKGSVVIQCTLFDPKTFKASYKDTCYVKVDRDPVFIKDIWYPEVKKFWNEVLDGRKRI